MWIFGYGSLIWRPGFAFEERRPGYVTGWTRRFYQGSPDHRGVPEAPGRVVTLLEEPDARTWGVAYRLSPQVSERVLAQLDVREQGGYERRTLRVHGPAAPIEALTYMATTDNPHYLGPAPAQAIAQHVLASRGPSGPNTEYVLELAEALRQLEAEDAHVFAIEEALRRLMSA